MLAVLFTKIIDNFEVSDKHLTLSRRDIKYALRNVVIFIRNLSLAGLHVRAIAASLCLCCYI